MSKIKISILGCSGKTGKKVLHHVFLDDENFEIKNCLVSESNEFLNQDLSKILKVDRKLDVIATNDLKKVIDGVDIIIDFSVLEITKQLMELDLENRKMIIGVTNIDSDLQEKINEQSKNNMIFQASNMSIGVALINNFLKNNKKVINDQYDIIINDIHHNKKKDAPSGTAKSFKKSLGNDHIDVHSSRIGDVFGIHEILMISSDEMVKITHEAMSRDIFAIGALRVARWIHSVNKNGLYDMEDFLKDF